MARSPLLLLLACVLGLVRGTSAQLVPGNKFPYYDQCRRNAAHSGQELIALKPEKLEGGAVKMCFKINVKKSCTPETFKFKGHYIKSRCCNTTFAKVKMYVDPKCKWQFHPSPVEVPRTSRSAGFAKAVSPTWSANSVPEKYAMVKFTQFGPILQSQVQDTKFCLVLTPGPCSLKDFMGISNPTARAKKIFQVAIYDRKKDGYECCPTFTYPASP